MVSEQLHSLAEVAGGDVQSCVGGICAEYLLERVDSFGWRDEDLVFGVDVNLTGGGRSGVFYLWRLYAQHVVSVDVNVVVAAPVGLV